MKSLYLQYKLIILPILVGIASLIIIVFVIVPQVQNLLEGQQKLSLEKNRLAIVEAKAEELENINQDIYNQKLGIALASLPIEKDLNVTIGVFRQLAASVSMSLSSMRLNSQGAENDGFTVRAEMFGPTKSLGDLLEVIDNSPRIMKLQSFETASVGNSTDVVSVSMIVKVYYSPAPTTLGPVDTPLPVLTERDGATLDKLTQNQIPLGQTVVLPNGKTNPFE
jgi:hypothetical protein